MLLRLVAVPVSLAWEEADAEAEAEDEVDRFLKLGPRRNGRLLRLLLLLLFLFFGLVSDCRLRRLWLDTFMACCYYY